jgi:hypothetical protein
MKKINEAVLLSTGNATSLMVFIELAYMIEKQRGMLSVAFPKLGNRGLLKMMKPFSSNETYLEKKDQLLGMAERFNNNAPLKLLYKTLAFLSDKKTTPEESDARMQDINRVLSKIERMINGKLTSDEKELFSSMEDSIDNMSDSLNSNLNNSIESSVGTEEPEEAPAEEPSEQPTDKEKSEEDPSVSPKTEPKPAETPTSEPNKTEKPKEEPKSADTPKEQPKPTETPEEPKDKEKTEEQFRSLIKRLVRESLRDYNK